MSSENKETEKLVGKRPRGNIAINMPYENRYRCPICKKEQDETLNWSEYNGFLYCHRCDLDIPTCFCIPDLDNKDKLQTAINLFLRQVKDAINTALSEEIRNYFEFNRNKDKKKNVPPPPLRYPNRENKK